MSILLTVLSPERKLLEKVAIEELTFSSAEGEIQILPGHVPMIGIIETGALRFKRTGGVEEVASVSTGTFEVSNDEVVLTAETLELASEIDAARARRAQSAAEEALREGALDEARFRKYQLKLERALIRQQLASRQ